MSAIPVDEVLLQELNQLIGIKMLTRFSDTFWFLVPIPGGQMPVSPPLQTLTKVAHRISMKNKMSMKKNSSDLATLAKN